MNDDEYRQKRVDDAGQAMTYCMIAAILVVVTWIMFELIAWVIT